MIQERRGPREPVNLEARRKAYVNLVRALPTVHLLQALSQIRAEHDDAVLAPLIPMRNDAFSVLTRGVHESQLYRGVGQDGIQTGIGWGFRFTGPDATFHGLLITSTPEKIVFQAAHATTVPLTGLKGSHVLQRATEALREACTQEPGVFHFPKVLISESVRRLR